MAWLRFYGECIRHAPKTAWAWIGGFSTLATFVPLITAKVFHIANQDIVDTILFFSPLIVFLFCIVVVPLRESYRLYEAKERESAIAKSSSEVEKQQLERQIDELRTQLSIKDNELAERDRNIEAKDVAHQAELHRARTSNPKTNAIRTAVHKWIHDFEELKRYASQGEILAGVLYTLEQQADSYLRRHLPEYEDFCREYRIENPYGLEQKLSSVEAHNRIESRLKHLNKVLEALS